MTGANYWLYVGPIIFFLTLVAWVCLLLIRGYFKRPRGGEKFNSRGPVEGAIVRGSPAQVNAGHFVALPDIEEPSRDRPHRPSRRPRSGTLRALFRLLARAVGRPRNHSPKE